MSVYAIADAINRLGEKYEKVMKEKNKIEREKLEFEKEKFKQLTQQSEQQSKECEHNWVYTDSTFDPSFMEYHIMYTCSKCGKTKTEVKNSISTT